jgi:hypothetical protein
LGFASDNPGQTRQDVIMSDGCAEQLRGLAHAGNALRNETGAPSSPRHAGQCVESLS